METALKEFATLIKTLTTNDKYIINKLSVMAMEAKENSQLSKEIAKIAMCQIFKAPANVKLPLFYVVDSIIKNVGSPYKEVFAEKITDAFINTFQSNKDPKIRIKLYNLRLTWRDHFPSILMNSLDEEVRKFDLAWPLVTKFEPKSKVIDPKKVDTSDGNSSKSSPDSTTPAVSRDPRISKLALPEVKKERKRKIEDEENDELFTIDRHGDNQLKKVVNKRGRLDEKPLPKNTLTDGLFGTKDIDLRETEERCVRDKQWTSEDVFRMLKKNLHNGNSEVPVDVQPEMRVMPQTTLPAPREPTWKVVVEGFPQLPPIGTDPRLLARCPFYDPFRTITIDGRKYLLYLDRIQPCIFVNNELHAVRFFCHDLELQIDGINFILSTNGLTHIRINRRFYIACLGGPGHELIINGWPYNVRIDGNLHQITVGGFTVNVQFLVRRPIQVNVQLAIPPYICEWAVKNLFGSPQYLNIPPLNPLRNPKLNDVPSNIFRDELNINLTSRQDSENAANQKSIASAPPVSIDVHDLFQKLVATGIILPHKGTDLKLDITKYSWDLFKLRNEKEISEMYSGHQCDLCGTRFKNKDSKEFELHLDYHFYKNTTSLTSTRKSRDYVGGSRQWILGGSLRSSGPDFSFEQGTELEQKFKCPMFEDEKLNKCAVCMEGFEVAWDDEEESFMLQDGQLHNGKVYHPICLEDADKQMEEVGAQAGEGGEGQVGLREQPLEALERVLQGKSEAVVLPEDGGGEGEGPEAEGVPVPAPAPSDQDFDYESVNT